MVKGFKVLFAESRSLVRRELDFYRIIPRTSILFMTYRCDSKCKTCTMWQRPKDEEIGREIGLDAWKIIIDKLAAAGIESAEPFGGNVLLRKELLVSVLEYLHENGMSIHLPINQVGFDDQVAEAVVKYVDKVYLSMDGVGDGLDLVRGIDGATHLAEGTLDKLLRLKNCSTRNGPHPLRIVCNCTVSKFNAGSLEGMVEFAASRGFDEIHFEYAGEFEKEDVEASRIMGIVPDAQYMRQGASILASKDEARQIKKSLKAIKNRYKKSSIVVQTINIDSLSVKNLYEGTIPHKKCYVERNEVTIDPYGNIVICPFITNYILGNLMGESFKHIWNNEKHRIFREAQNTGRLPMCRHCILGAQRNPGILKSLQRIYLKRIQPKLPYYDGSESRSKKH